MLGSFKNCNLSLSPRFSVLVKVSDMIAIKVLHSQELIREVHLPTLLLSTSIP